MHSSAATATANACANDEAVATRNTELYDVSAVLVLTPAAMSEAPDVRES